MADDLSSFFAKKAQKAKDKKKKGVVHLEDVGNQLERRTRREEETTVSENEERQRGGAGGGLGNNGAWANSSGGGGGAAAGGEDSEWLEFNDGNERRLEGLKIKDMNVDSIDEDGEEQDAAKDGSLEDGDVSASNQPGPRSWAQIEKTPSAAPLLANVKEVNAAVEVTTTTKYRTPAQRLTPMAGAVHRPGAQLNLDDQEAFPTFALADTMEEAAAVNRKKAAAVATARTGEKKPAWTKIESLSMPEREGDAESESAGKRKSNETKPADEVVKLRGPPKLDDGSEGTAKAWVSSARSGNKNKPSMDESVPMAEAKIEQQAETTAIEKQRQLESTPPETPKENVVPAKDDKNVEVPSPVVAVADGNKAETSTEGIFVPKWRRRTEESTKPSQEEEEQQTRVEKSREDVKKDANDAPVPKFVPRHRR